MPTKCPAGSFQSSPTMGVCTNCPAGNYCVLGTSVPVACPAGYYCLVNTKRADEYPCDKGKYNSATSATSQNQCSSCPAGNV